jgi:hypothetical protein
MHSTSLNISRQNRALLLDPVENPLRASKTVGVAHEINLPARLGGRSGQLQIICAVPFGRKPFDAVVGEAAKKRLRKSIALADCSKPRGLSWWFEVGLTCWMSTNCI